jgi:hypothetical protein
VPCNWLADYRQSALAGEPVERRLHHLADVGIDLGDVRVLAESGGDVDGGHYRSDDLARQRQVRAAQRQTEGEPAAMGTISLRVNRLMKPRRLASPVPQVKKNCASTMAAHYDPSLDDQLEQRMVTELTAGFTEVMGQAPPPPQPD